MERWNSGMMKNLVASYELRVNLLRLTYLPAFNKR